MIKLSLDWKDIPKKGYTFYELDCVKSRKNYCIWWSYPAFALYLKIRRRKIHLYHWLNDKGIMKTTHGCKMVFSDLWRK